MAATPLLFDDVEHAITQIMETANELAGLAQKISLPNCGGRMRGR